LRGINSAIGKDVDIILKMESKEKVEELLKVFGEHSSLKDKAMHACAEARRVVEGRGSSFTALQGI
jgi:hypothetical protein